MTELRDVGSGTIMLVLGSGGMIITGMLKLGVNIDHVATVRQARYRDAAHAAMVPEPDPVMAALACVEAGAHGITAHLREDRRHIQEADVRRLREVLSVPLNLEMGVTEAMIDLAVALRPAEVCLVPENRKEVTTEGGLDVAGQAERVRLATERLKGAGSVVSLFIDADAAQVAAAAAVGAPCIELHTGRYANASGAEEIASSLRQLREAAEQANGLGLQVNAGHGLNYTNLAQFLATPHLDTLNIGHSIVSRAVFVGMKQAVGEMLALMR
jgi:pyridoxine 5-phosphate synthase